MRHFRIVIALFLFLGHHVLPATCAEVNYEVVLVRGQVIYKGVELKRGVKIEIPDLDIAANMKLEIQNFSFGSASDEVQLLDKARRKIVLVSARITKQGRDLMLATRGIKFIKSDFEFKRAFSPGSKVITLISEDTLICLGLEKYRFSGDKLLIARYNYQGNKINQTIGRNDTLLLTRKQLFEIETPEGPVKVNSFEVENIQFLKPFSIYFLDDILQYFAAVEYNNIRPDEEVVYHSILPNFVSEKQIQREIGIYSENEAREWLRKRIHTFFSQY
jgi:hypothetical protein